MTHPLTRDFGALADAPGLHDTRTQRVQTDPDADRLWKQIFEQGHAVATAASAQSVDAPTAPSAPPTRDGASPDRAAGPEYRRAEPASVSPQTRTAHRAPAANLSSGARSPASTDGANGVAAGRLAGIVPAGDEPAQAWRAPAPLGAEHPWHAASANAAAPPRMTPGARVAGDMPTAATPAMPAAASAMPVPTLPLTRATLAALRQAAPSPRAAPHSPAQAAFTAPLDDEVVQVFHRDGVVEITIRDLALVPASALRCAIEAARQLAGDARALKQVTLNGKSIYDSRDGARAADTAAHPRVSFTC